MSGGSKISSRETQILAWILGLFALSSLVSQSLMDALSIIFVLFMLALAVLGRIQWKDLFPKTGIDWLWPLWIAIVVAGYLVNAPGSLLLWPRIWEFTWVTVFYLMIRAFLILKPTEALLKYLNPALIFFSSLSIAFYIFNYFPFEPYGDPGRLGGLLNDPMTFAHSTGMIFTGLYCFFIYRYKKVRQFLPGFTWNVGLLGLTLLLSFTRGVWIGCFISLGVAGFFLGKKVGIVNLIFLGFLGLSFYKFWPSFKDRVNFAFNAKNNYDQQRIILWKLNLTIFNNYKWLGAGWGENTKKLPIYYQRMNLPKDFIVSHAHNQFLHLLAGTGVLGLSCYLLFFGFFLTGAFRLFQVIPQNEIWDRGLVLGVGSAQIEFLVSGLTEANFEHAKVRFVLLFLLALQVYLHKKYQLPLLGKRDWGQKAT